MSNSNFEQLIARYEKPSRIAISSKYPILKRPVLTLRHITKKLKNHVAHTIARTHSNEFYPSIIARHQSVIRRKLGNTDPRLQEQKVTNLRRACEDLHGLIIKPNEVFSLWETIGKPTPKRGYVNGMLLSNGKIVEGVGGGLCQLSNFLCWIFQHADTEIIERYHHSMDVFPDSGRTLPFGSGATCMYNIVDLQIKNTSNQDLQLKLWLTETHLKGQLVASKNEPVKFDVREKNHTFIKRGDRYFRYNEIYKVAKLEGKEISEKHLFTNFAPVLYPIEPTYFEANNLNFVDLT